MSLGGGSRDRRAQSHWVRCLGQPACEPATIRTVPHPDRLSGLDASFLALEKAGAHMHVGSVLVFDGDPPDYEELLELIEQRLHQVPRYRQKLALPPPRARAPMGRHPHLNGGEHVRHGAPSPAFEHELRRLAGRNPRAAARPPEAAWEIRLVDRVGEDHFAHVVQEPPRAGRWHLGLDIIAVLFDLEADPPERYRALVHRCPVTERSSLFADAVLEHARRPSQGGEAAAVSSASRRAPRAGGPPPGGPPRRPRGACGGARARSERASARTGASPGSSRAGPLQGGKGGLGRRSRTSC